MILAQAQLIDIEVSMYEGISVQQLEMIARLTDPNDEYMLYKAMRIFIETVDHTRCLEHLQIIAEIHKVFEERCGEAVARLLLKLQQLNDNVQ